MRIKLTYQIWTSLYKWYRFDPLKGQDSTFRISNGTFITFVTYFSKILLPVCIFDDKQKIRSVLSFNMICNAPNLERNDLAPKKILQIGFSSLISRNIFSIFVPVLVIWKNLRVIQGIKEFFGGKKFLAFHEVKDFEN